MTAGSLLIADDQPDLLAALRLLCKGEGFEVETADSPVAVLRAIQGRQYDAVLMDMNYARDTTSGTEGLDLLAAVRHVDQLTPVIVMTAWSTVGLAVDAMRRGACDFIQKPWDNARVVATLHEQIARGRSARQSDDAATWLDHDLARAATVQAHLLATSAPGTLDCAVHCQPAHGVGGDFYEVAALDTNRTLIVVGDVAGKGVAAALMMAHLQAHVRQLASRPQATPAWILGSLNQWLCKADALPLHATAFCAVHDETSDTLTFATAGHPAALCVGTDRRVARLATDGPALGLFSEAAFTEAIVPFCGDDRLIAFTDGVTDATNRAGDEFGDQRLQDAALPAAADAGSALESILKAHGHFAEGEPAFDDVTVLVARPRSHTARPTNGHLSSGDGPEALQSAPIQVGSVVRGWHIV